MPAPIKILHLEDLPEDAELVQREIRKANINCDIRMVDDKQGYEEALTSFMPDIIISDHSLPFFSSHEALAILQSKQINIPFILVTATVSEDFAVGIIKQGATDYILKDRLQRLPSVIQKALENKRLEAEHQQFLQEIITSETLMNDAQELANFGSFAVAIPSLEARLSKEAFFIFGFAPGEKPATCQLYPADRLPMQFEKLRLQVGDVFLDLSPYKKDYTIIDKFNRLKFIAAEFRLEKKPDGSLIGIKGFLYNVTRLRSAELKLQQSEANLKTIFETTDTGYLLFSKDQRVVSFNKKAAFFVQDQNGLQLKEGELLTTYITNEIRETVNNGFNTALAGNSTTYESCFINKAGQTRWYFSRWFPVTGDNSRNHGVILVISDITEKKLVELERDKIANDLVARNTALEQFSYIVCHNLRAPVANIMGIAGILRNTEDKAQIDTSQFLEALDVSIVKLDTIVQDLNHILRISKHVNEEPQVVYFQQLTDEIRKQLHDTIEKSSATIISNFTAVMYTRAVKSFLHHIFFNLIHNSLMYKKENTPTKISISSAVKDDRLVITFTDNGKGIDMQRVGNKIFGLYQRFDSLSEGKGMGLCIVKTLLTSMGGVINVESAPGKGATFTISMPLQKN